MASDFTLDSDPQNSVPDGAFTAADSLLMGDILERVRDAFIVLDREWRVVYANKEACRINQKPLAEFVGRTHWDEWPETVGTEVERQYRRAMAEQEEVHFEHHFAGPSYDVWLEMDVYPTSDGVSIFYRDITKRRTAELALQEATQRTARILESMTDAFFVLDPQWRFTYLNDQAERLLRPRAVLLGRSIWDEYPEAVGGLFYHEYHRAVAEQTAVSFEAYSHYLSTWREVHAYPSPEGLSVYFHDIQARKKAEEERERLLMEQRARAEREALLNRIGQVLRRSSDPEAIYEAAVHLLGEALRADRCYFAVYDLAHGSVTIRRDFHRAGLSAVEGVYPFVNTVEMFHELYHDSHTSIIPDRHTSSLSAQTLSNMERLNLRSRVSVALVEADGLMATLTAAMADAPREWTDEDVALVEAVATHLRTTVEMARAAQREHTIATQLQEALQPDLPGSVPGLALAKYYRPALAQTEGVGGDFFDVYAVEKGCAALVVGDLSGKGLVAAAQVSTVRNMLRAYLYTRLSVVEAVTKLNRVLAENNLLIGFSTLFVSVYDGGTRELVYVNCGQEPALVRRAVTGIVEELAATGPILGSIENAEFAEVMVRLEPGDALAIFTDGLTEIGPSRRDMLGVKGLISIFEQPLLQEAISPASQRAEAFAQQLMTGVDAAAAGGVMRDDMCLLVGVV